MTHRAEDLINSASTPDKITPEGIQCNHFEIINPLILSIRPYLSNPKHGHPKGGTGWGSARWGRARAGQSKAVRRSEAERGGARRSEAERGEKVQAVRGESGAKRRGACRPEHDLSIRPPEQRGQQY